MNAQERSTINDVARKLSRLISLESTSYEIAKQIDRLTFAARSPIEKANRSEGKVSWDLRKERRRRAAVSLRAAATSEWL